MSAAIGTSLQLQSAVPGQSPTAVGTANFNATGQREAAGDNDVFAVNSQVNVTVPSGTLLYLQQRLNQVSSLALPIELTRGWVARTVNDRSRLVVAGV